MIKEVLDCVRGYVGSEYIVGMRVTIDEAIDGGFGLKEGLEIWNTLAETGMIDFYNVNVGEVATYVVIIKTVII